MAIDRSELIQQAMRELEVPVPRQLRLRTFGEAGGLWGKTAFGFVLILFIGVIFFYQFLVPIVASYFGTSNQALVLSRWQTHGKGASNNIRVDYSIGAQKEKGTIRLTYGAYSRVFEGETVPIHYLFLFPGKPSLDDSSPWGIEIFIPLLFVAILIGFILKLRKQKYLLIQGKVIKGKVTGKGSKTNDVQFDFEGKAFDLTMPVSYYDRSNSIDDPVVVLVNAETPNYNVVYDPSNSYWVPVRSSIYE